MPETQLFNLHDLFIILDTVCDSITIVDTDGIVVWVNKKSLEFLKKSREEIIGNHVEESIPDEKQNKTIVLEAIRSKTATSGVIHLENGLELLVRCQPLRDSQGQIKYYVSTATSLLELNQLWNFLQAERRKTSEYSREIEKLRSKLQLEEGVFFSSTTAQALLDHIKKVAPINCTVLITGESGTGKEVVAKTIHSNSLRKHKPFVAVCIPALPEHLLESELFGYEEGAFTGAQCGGKIGLFEAAQGGTLLLDEIGDMPLPMQVKILRALESREIRRLGGTTNIRLDVRVLAATNKYLPDLINKGLFREDLFYRLNVVHIHVQALREQCGNIAPLVLQFLKNFSVEYNITRTISRQAMSILEAYEWPGNIRELKNIVERLAILSDNSLISDTDVYRVLHSLQRPHAPVPVTSSPCDAGTTLMTPAQAYQTFEHTRILDALKQTHGNKSKAAKLLGMSRSRLYRKLDQID